MFPVRDEAGRVVRVTGIAEDVTEQKAAEGAVREAEERFRAFIDNGPAVAFMKDEQGRYVYFNQCFAETFPRHARGVAGAHGFRLPAGAAGAVELREADQRVLREGRPVAVEVTIPDPAGPRSTRWG